MNRGGEEFTRRLASDIASGARIFDLKFLAGQLSPGDQLGEVLCGVIMTLTFTLGAGVVAGNSADAGTTLLYSTLGCNVAWGVIDGALLILDRVFDRSRLTRLGRVIAGSADEQRALAIVAEELDETLVPITSEDLRLALYRDVVNHARAPHARRLLVKRADVYAAIGVFWAVTLATLPAALPYLVIDDPWVAIRTSNALLIANLFWLGFRWAKFTSINPWLAGISLTSIGVVLVLVAMALGG